MGCALSKSAGISFLCLIVSGLMLFGQGRSLGQETQKTDAWQRPESDLVGDGTSPKADRESGPTSRIFFKPEKSPLTQVLGVDFTLMENSRSRLTITTDKKARYEIREEGEARLLVLMDNATIPPLLMRRLDARYFEGAIKKVKAFADGRKVTLRVELREKVVYGVKQDQGTLEVDFGPSTRRPDDLDLASRLKRSKAPRGETVGQGGKREEISRAKVYEAASRDYAGERMSFDFVDADIRNVLKLIAEVADINIVWGSDVQGKVSMKLDDVPWDQALEMVLKPNGLTYQIEENVLWVAPKSTLIDLEIKEKERRGALMAQKRVQGIFEPKVIEYIIVRHRKVEDLFRLLMGGEGRPGVLDIDTGESEEEEKGEEKTGKKTKIVTVDILLTYDPGTNIVIVNGVRSKVEKVKEVISKLDVPQKQVMIEARVIEATTSFSEELGVQWNNVSVKAGDATFNFATNFSPFPNMSTLGVAFSNAALSTVINAKIGLAESEGRVSTLSAPRIITQDAIQAEIRQGTQIALPSGKDSFGNIVYTMVDAVLKLAVTPKITANNMVVMDILVTDDSPDYANAQEGNVPIKTKSAKTQMMVATGETVVIGGIYKEDKSVTQDAVPWLSEIPVFGWLFKLRRTKLDKTELLIFLTPTVISSTAERL